MERLATGGMASVWLGFDETLARHVAVKVLHEHLAADDAFRQRFRREAVSAARLSHPNIVGLYDTGWGDDQVWLVMELVEGLSLKDALARDGALEPGRAATIGERVARALAYAHEHGVVHRDVKPGNILLANDTTAKVADFGIAQVEGSAEITRTGTMLGTAAYVSPEQLRARRLDGATDQYSLGCVLYETLTGRQPFESDSAVATATRRLEADPPAPTAVRGELPAGLDDVIRRAMAREPEDRYPGIAAFADALASFAPHGGADPPPASATAPPAAGSPGGRDRPSARPAPAPPRNAGVWPQRPGGTEAAAADRSPVRTLTSEQERDAEGPAEPAADAAAADWEPEPRRRSLARTDVRWLAVGLGLVLAAAGLLGLVTASFVNLDGLLPPGLGTAEDTTPDGGQPQPADAIAPADVGLFDPEGGSSESPEGLDNLLDGNPATGWDTVGYNTPAFGNLKSGVGFWMDLGRAHELDLVALRSTTPGVSVEIRVADQRATTAAGWRPVARGRAVSGLTELSLAGTEARYVLVWVTGRLQPDGSGRYRAGFSELAVVGTPAAPASSGPPT